MKYKTLSQVHTEAMNDHEYSAAFEAEEASELLRETLATWRKEAGLTSAQVAERMGIKRWFGTPEPAVLTLKFSRFE